MGIGCILDRSCTILRFDPIALVFIQLLFPGASLLGHASGIAVGFFVGLFEAYVIEPYFLKKLEDHPWMKPVKQSNLYVKLQGPSDFPSLPRYSVLGSSVAGSP
jgi:hypothetical protein